MNKKGFITISTLLTLLLATPFLGSMIIGVETADQIYNKVEEIPAKDLGVIFGAAAYGDRLSDILRDRVDTGIELFEGKKVTGLLMTGAPNETAAMKKYALAHGVPAEAVTEDPAGLSTMASITNLSNLHRSAILVSQRYHLNRILFLAHKRGMEVVGMTADKGNYLKILAFKARELVATSVAVLDGF